MQKFAWATFITGYGYSPNRDENVSDSYLYGIKDSIDYCVNNYGEYAALINSESNDKGKIKI